MDADDHGKRKRQKKTKDKESKKKGGFAVARCENLFPGNIKDHFPTPMSTFVDCHFESTHFEYEMKHIYPPGIQKKKNRTKIVKGMRLGKDIKSLLSNGGKRDYLVSNNGVKVPLLDKISGKYLLIHCIAIPIMADDVKDAELCRNLISAYSQLKAAAYNFEMVIVARISSLTMVVNDDEEAAFNRFFNAFSCLAVPFSDSESRDFICYSLGLTTADSHSCSLLLDPHQLVLLTDADCFNHFGAAAFPFTTHHLDALYRQDQEIILRLDFIEREIKSSKEAITTPWVPVSLVELLGSCHLLRRIGCINKNNNEKEDIISVSELSKKKCVGLYLCYDGNFIPMLDTVYKDCVANNLEFELVLVYIPFHSDTTSFINAVNHRLDEEQITSWWVMPLVDEVCRRLWRLVDEVPDDELVVLTDDGWGELNGTSVIRMKGYMDNYCYPFTRKKVLDKYLDHFRSLTVESLLNVSHLISHSGDNVSVSVLKDKHVLLCIDRPGSRICQLVHESYNCIQKKHPGTQVVFVRYDDQSDDQTNPEPGNHPPWLLCLPLEAALSVNERIYLEADMPSPRTIVALGKEGVVVSREAQYRIENISSLFDDTLRQELIKNLYKILKS